MTNLFLSKAHYFYLHVPLPLSVTQVQEVKTASRYETTAQHWRNFWRYIHENFITHYRNSPTSNNQVFTTVVYALLSNDRSMTDDVKILKNFLKISLEHWVCNDRAQLQTTTGWYNLAVVTCLRMRTTRMLWTKTSSQ